MGETYRWPRTNMAMGTNSFKPQDAILQNPLVDVWHHHMRRDENDLCGAIPRTRTEWRVFSDELIWNERNMPQVSSARSKSDGPNLELCPTESRPITIPGVESPGIPKLRFAAIPSTTFQRAKALAKTG